MDMINVKTDDLIGPALDWAVAISQGEQPSLKAGWSIVFVHDTGYRPSESWSRGGPLIDKHEVCLIVLPTGCPTKDRTGEGIWSAKLRDLDTDYGHLNPTALIAAMRAIVRAKLGDSVDVPVSLVLASEP